MKIIKKYLSFFLLLPSLMLANEYVVIANKKVKNISQNEIKSIFLKKVSSINKIKMVPVNLEARDPLREKFEKELLQMNFARLKAYWAKQHYLGNRPPLSLKSQESVKAFVKKVDGAIGYIEKKHLDSNFNVLYSWED